MFDLGILNGQIYNNGVFNKANLYIKDGIIEGISSSYLSAKKEYDVKNKLVLPGFIDPHVHFSLDCGKYISRDNFESGSIAASYGGITTFIDFLNPTEDSFSLRKAFENRKKEAENSVVDYSFHSTIKGLSEEVEPFINTLNDLKIPSVKLFTTYSSSGRRTKDNIICELLKCFSGGNNLILVHAENDLIISENENILVKDHNKNRPEISEISEVCKLASMAEYYKGKIYIVHTNCGTTINYLKEKYNALLGNQIFIESCPHYFIFDDKVYEKENGYLYSMTPPLRNECERDLLKKNIDYVNTIGTDHCPFLIEEKKKDYVKDIPMGIGGVEYSFPLMFTLFGEKIIDKYTINPAKIHGLYPRKGTLNIGSDGDIVIYDPTFQGTIKENHSSCDYNLYEDMVIKGKVISTISRGEFVVKDEVFMGGKGKYIERGVL